jgi:hypothetical protein
MRVVTCPACGAAIPREVAARALGGKSASKAGRASAAALTPEQRRERARRAVAARWAKRDADRARDGEGAPDGKRVA